ncbi:hypothetical protein [Deinococcus sp. Marseille-Q6407]|uniref:hypothetical protein n=1 Tax=Deinococcus sp. Marseille-Q6407 TaxID=2969223 RepID=UPI0021BF0C93|nr:hypothetical protein [Deinococcus sp. Marseille-Q6407]
MTPLLLRTAQRTGRPALLGLLGALSLTPSLPAAAQTLPQPAAAQSQPALSQSTQAQPKTPPRAALALPDPALSRLAVELSGTVGGRFYRCPPSLELPAQAICLYVRGESAALQTRLAAQLCGRARGSWQTRGPVQSLPLQLAAPTQIAAPERPSEDQALSLLDLGGGDQLLVLGRPWPVAAAAPVPSTPAEVDLYLTPADLIGVVRVERLGERTYRLTPQGGQPASLNTGERQLIQGGKTASLPAALQQQGGQLYIPVSVLRSIGCVLSPTEGALTVACGNSSVGTSPRRL